VLNRASLMKVVRPDVLRRREERRRVFIGSTVMDAGLYDITDA
jgi:hypothetical protein